MDELWEEPRTQCSRTLHQERRRRRTRCPCWTAPYSSSGRASSCLLVICLLQAMDYVHCWQTDLIPLTRINISGRPPLILLRCALHVRCNLQACLMFKVHSSGVLHISGAFFRCVSRFMCTSRFRYIFQVCFTFQVQPPSSQSQTRNLLLSSTRMCPYSAYTSHCDVGGRSVSRLCVGGGGSPAAGVYSHTPAISAAGWGWGLPSTCMAFREIKRVFQRDRGVFRKGSHPFIPCAICEEDLYFVFNV